MFQRTKKSLLVLMISSLCSGISYADDLDIIAPSVEGEKNILFIMDLSGSMRDHTVAGTDNGNGNEQTRVEVLTEAFIGMTGNTEFDDYNIGLSVFSGQGQSVGKGVAHGIAYPVSPLAESLAQDVLNTNANFTHKGSSFMPAVSAATDTTRDYFETLVNDTNMFWEAGGGTPLIDALFEASLYFKGEAPYLGQFDESDIRSAHPSTFTGNIGSTALYNSPISECSSDTIVLLTDGFPTKNYTSNQIVNFLGPTNAANLDPALSGFSDCSQVTEAATTDTQYAGRCGLELAKFMATKDSDLTTDDKDVKIFPIAFELEGDTEILDYLDKMADYGNPDGVDDGYGNIVPATAISVSGANSAIDLQDAFERAASSTADDARSFSASSFSVDTSTLLTNDEFVYVPVFDQSQTSLWPGNLKKFKLVDGVLTDKNGDDALDSSNALLETAEDFWKDANEAALDEEANQSVLSGGAANRIPDGTVRNVYTDNGNGVLIDLDDNLDKSLFGTNVDEALKDTLVKFIRGTNEGDGDGDGINDDDYSRNHMGDIIHSTPVQLTYEGGDKLIFVGTNEGYIHAIDDATGIEEYAFMPSELLANIYEQYSGASTAEHIYGVDSTITLWIDESNQSDSLLVDNGVLDGAGVDEKAYIFFGLRRGGGAYTAIDVSDPNSPELLWSKSFSDANSWSQPTIANFTWKEGNDENTLQPVMVIGGGFNDDTDNVEQAGGNNVYVVDAMTGDEIWNTEGKSASVEGDDTGDSIIDAVPGSIRVIDVDKDDSIDRLYFGDTGGNIWRVDLNAGSYDADTSKHLSLDEIEFSKIAELGGTGANDRKFFEEPDVAIFNSNGTLVTAIAIGSGDRPNPLSNTASDKFFLFYDLAVTRLRLDTDIKATLSTLENVSSDVPDDQNGWYIDLNETEGEKVLSSPLIYSGKILFNTLAITNLDTENSCETGVETESTLYVLDLFTGVEDYKETSGDSGEILGSPSVIITMGDCEVGDCEIEVQISSGGKDDLIDFPTSKNPDGTVDTSATSVSDSVIEKVYWIDTGKL